MNLKRIDAFHKTRVGYLVFGLVELGLAAMLAYWALSEGEWLDWLLTAVLLLGVVQNAGRFVVTFARRQKGKTAK